MRLFVAGEEPNSVLAVRNIKEICTTHLAGKFRLDIIDVYVDFLKAIQENIVVTPTLLIDKPKKVKIFGNLQETKKVLSALDIL